MNATVYEAQHQSHNHGTYKEAAMDANLSEQNNNRDSVSTGVRANWFPDAGSLRRRGDRAGRIGCSPNTRQRRTRWQTLAQCCGWSMHHYWVLDKPAQRGTRTWIQKEESVSAIVHVDNSNESTAAVKAGSCYAPLKAAQYERNGNRKQRKLVLGWFYNSARQLKENWQVIPADNAVSIRVNLRGNSNISVLHISARSIYLTVNPSSDSRFGFKSNLK